MALASAPYLGAAESAVVLFPTLKNKPEQLPAGTEYSGRLSAFSFTGNVYGYANSWRSKIQPKGNGSTELEFKTGDWERPDSNKVPNVWVSYDLNWEPFTAAGQTITYSYTFGESTIGMSSSFRMAATKESRMEGHLGDCALILNFGGTDCLFYLNGETSSGKLKEPVSVGTTVSITLFPNKTLEIEIDDTLVITDQSVPFDENYIVFSASGEGRSDPLAPRMLTLRDVKVETK